MTTVTNPILPGCYPDPSICRVGDDYYLVTSTFEYFPGLPIHHSRDLVSWTQIGSAIDREGQLDMAGVPSSGGLYAPTLRHHNGVFWIACTMVDSSDRSRGGNFLLTATDPAGPWSDPIWLEGGGIDPSLFFDDDGRMWVHGTRLVLDPPWHDQTEVWVRELDPQTMSFVGDEHILWNGALLGAVWAEAPHLYKIGDFYYLLTAEGGTDLHHAVSVARSEHVTGPYVGNRANPVLTHRNLGRTADIVGVGHADLVEAVDGSWWAVLLAMRPYGGYHYNLGRETFLVPVEWEDGWPIFAPGVGQVSPTLEVPGSAAVQLAPQAGPVGPDDPRWTSLRGPVTAFATPQGDGWRLALQPVTLAQRLTPTFLGVRQQHVDVDVTATIRPRTRLPHEHVGLVLRQSEGDHATVYVAPGPDGGMVVRAAHRRSGDETVLAETPLELSSDGTVTLMVRARGQEYSLAVETPSGTETLAVVDGRELDPVTVGGFLGLWMGVYATSNGQPSDATADVVTFDYRPGA
ncbi:glycoside hydrolase family 43 protein [Tessaracoccus antarcticus]|uniref:Glycoside hydrolase family 43 protein n=1 Tax=Tessaracoccus antarcticus TaxID=2479848 RepID=A0A3M0GJU6_9ACTN|nr:glycoside hydrolase family 43 protein [Tessaracoccus antarcticus]RMB61903.1 glycoside hydrolase family 43 protein [Tessaracoccus antarcticus]